MRIYLLAAVLCFAGQGCAEYLPEEDSDSSQWCGLPANEPEAAGLPVIRLGRSDLADTDDFQQAYDQLRCRGTLLIEPAVWLGADGLLKRRITRAKDGTVCNLKFKGIPDQDGKLPHLKGWLPQMGGQFHGCFRYENLVVGGSAPGERGKNHHLGPNFSFLGFKNYHYRYRPRMIVGLKPKHKLPERWSEEKRERYSRPRFVEMLDSSFKYCRRADDGGGGHHCVYLLAPKGHLFVQNTEVGPTDWTAFRALFDSAWVRHSRFVGNVEPRFWVDRKGPIAPGTPAQMQACASSLWEHNEFDSGEYLNAPALLQFISRRSLGGCYDVLYPRATDPAYYQQLAAGGLTNIDNPLLKKHVLRNNRFVTHRKGGVPKGYAPVNMQGTSHRKNWFHPLKPVFVEHVKNWLDSSTLWVDDSNHFLGDIGANVDGPVTVDDARVGVSAQPWELQGCPKDKLRVTAVEEEMDDGIARAATVTGLARIAEDGSESPVPQAQIPATLASLCKPWDYQTYPVDRRSCVQQLERGKPGSGRMRCVGQDLDDARLLWVSDGEQIKPDQVLPEHALSQHWKSLAASFDGSGLQGKQPLPEPVDGPVYSMLDTGLECR